MIFENLPHAMSEMNTGAIDGITIRFPFKAKDLKIRRQGRKEVHVVTPVHERINDETGQKERGRWRLMMKWEEAR